MKFTSRKLLAAALLAAIPMGSALACTTDNWTSATNGGGLVTGTPTAGDPGDGVARYSGECGLSATAGSFVTNNAPDGESTYRARFYVYTGQTGDAVVFRATADDNNAGAEVLRVNYSAPNFNFFQNGNAAGSVAGIVANKWYAIELLYVAGQADGFSATVSGNQTFEGSVAPTAAGAGTIGSHSLGAISGGTGAARVDAFESTRSADTAIGTLCRGDVNGTLPINIFDRTAVTNEILNGTLAAGQPDCNEDGAINVFDRTCVTNIILAGGACP